MSPAPDPQDPQDRDADEGDAVPVSLEELTAVVSALDEAVTALTIRVAAAEKASRQAAGPPARPSAAGSPATGPAAPAREWAWWWPCLDDKATARAWERLGAWVEHALLARHPRYGKELLPCWRRHPGIVDELSALRAVWHAAYTGDTRDPGAAAEYLARWLPHTMERVEATFSRSGCSIAGGKDLHKDTDEKYQRPQWTQPEVAAFLTTQAADEPVSPDKL